MVVRHVVTAVHQVIRHDVDHVDSRPDLGSLFFGEGNHVAAFTWDCNRQNLVLANCVADGLHEERVRLNLAGFLGIGDLLVVVAVAAGVFPVDIYHQLV